MVLHIKHVSEHDEGNPGLRGGLVEICSRGELLGMHPKSHNIAHRLGIGKLMST